MMSRCTICGATTDLALSDVLTPKEVEAFGFIEIPLIGTCGDSECKQKQLDRYQPRHASDTKGSDEARCPNCGLMVRRDTWYAHYHHMHVRLDAPAFQWVYDNQKER